MSSVTPGRAVCRKLVRVSHVALAHPAADVRETMIAQKTFAYQRRRVASSAASVVVIAGLMPIAMVVIVRTRLRAESVYERVRRREAAVKGGSATRVAMPRSVPAGRTAEFLDVGDKVNAMPRRVYADDLRLLAGIPAIAASSVETGAALDRMAPV